MNNREFFLSVEVYYLSCEDQQEKNDTISRVATIFDKNVRFLSFFHQHYPKFRRY